MKGAHILRVSTRPDGSAEIVLMPGSVPGPAVPGRDYGFPDDEIKLH